MHCFDDPVEPLGGIDADRQESDVVEGERRDLATPDCATFCPNASGKNDLLFSAGSQTRRFSRHPYPFAEPQRMLRRQLQDDAVSSHTSNVFPVESRRLCGAR